MREKRPHVDPLRLIDCLIRNKWIQRNALKELDNLSPNEITQPPRRGTASGKTAAQPKRGPAGGGAAAQAELPRRGTASGKTAAQPKRGPACVGAAAQPRQRPAGGGAYGQAEIAEGVEPLAAGQRPGRAWTSLRRGSSPAEAETCWRRDSSPGQIAETLGVDRHLPLHNQSHKAELSVVVVLVDHLQPTDCSAELEWS
ncbi:hypothetical protein pipiens_012078 [Culex pipiens pipiens]|uniref:Uncharacterized protein n=1 Tax=Culex pipiens pipiens TaxID=38569 RepID=A0ABD1D4D9_CULPP